MVKKENKVTFMSLLYTIVEQVEENIINYIDLELNYGNNPRSPAQIIKCCMLSRSYSGPIGNLSEYVFAFASDFMYDFLSKQLSRLIAPILYRHLVQLLVHSSLIS